MIIFMKCICNSNQENNIWLSSHPEKISVPTANPKTLYVKQVQSETKLFYN